MAGEGSQPFVLSATLQGHQADVRTICEVNESTIATGSLDQLAKLWTSVPGDTPEYACTQTYQGHNRYIYSIAFIPPTAEFTDGLIATGSVDTNVHLYLPEVGDGPVRQLIGHSMAVCCVRAGPNETVLSASWDGTAKVWGLDGTCQLTLEGHQKSVLSIIAHPTPGKYITCSADRTIRIWNRDACMGAMTGHTDVPRDLAILPNGNLASCANDGTVKLWNLNSAGMCLQTLPAHSGSYIYSIAAFPSGANADFATSGEDGTVTVWKDGAIAQSIALPCNSVWRVTTRSNGDLLVACDDGCARVFSADQGRYASDDAIATFTEHVSQIALSKAGEADGKIGDLDTSNLVGPERLTTPGDSDGQIIMVKDGAKVMAHAWSAAENSWNCIGEVENAKETKPAGAPPGWQHFDVELDNRKMICRHKMGDNPFLTAQRFLDENELDQGLLDQVVDFVEKNATAPTLEFSQAPTAPVVPGAYVPGRGGGGQSAKPASDHFPVQDFIMMASVKLEGLAKTLEGLNASASPETQLDAEALGKLKAGLTVVSNNPTAPFPNDMYFGVAPACAKLLAWPVGDSRVPGMDAVRVLLSNNAFRSAAFKEVGTPLSLPELKTFMLETAGLLEGPGNAGSVPCQMLAFRALANAFGGDKGLQDHVAEFLPLLERFDASKLSKHSQIALSTFILNCAVAVVRKGDAAVAELGGELLRVIGHRLDLQLQAAAPDGEATYRMLVALGTLIGSSEIMVAVAMSLPEVASVVTVSAGSTNVKVKLVATDVRKIMS